MWKKLMLWFLMILSVNTILAGCSNKEYEKFLDDFYLTYYRVIDSTNIEETYKSIQKLQTESSKKDIEHLKILTENIKYNVPKSKQAEYEKICKWYDGLKYLSDAYEKWNELKEDERGRIDVEMGLIDIRKEAHAEMK